MAMTRRAKILLIILAIPLVLLVAAVIVLKAMFTSDKLKAMVIPRIEAATHRNVATNDISLALFPSLGVDLDGLTLSNRRGEGFSSTPFLTLDRLHVSVKLMPLLRSRMEVDALTLDHPRILIETNSKNETNYADMTGPADTVRAAGTEPRTSIGGAWSVPDSPTMRRTISSRPASKLPSLARQSAK